MAKKILVIDDSALMRRVISDIIKSRSEYEVADIARDGLDGLDRITRDPALYDAIVMDINMPKMSGLELLQTLQKFNLKQKVIVVSTVATEGAKETILALEYGAFDFVTKPVHYADVMAADFKTELLATLDVATGAGVNISSIPPSVLNGQSGGQSTGGTASVAMSRSQQTQGVQPVRPAVQHFERMRPEFGRARGSKLVALACSTGGPKSLQNVIPKLPANLDAPVVMVQHMPKGFTLSLAQRLNEISAIEVSEACDGDILEKGHVYIAPGGRHMEIEKVSASSYRIRLNDNPPVDALRPCANVMYDSLIESDYDEITCVVMTGMGADGTKGITRLSAKKNVHVIAQDEKSCVVYGMPKAIAEAGLVDEVKTLDEIADAITKNVGVS